LRVTHDNRAVLQRLDTSPEVDSHLTVRADLLDENFRAPGAEFTLAGALLEINGFENWFT
jgi:hypothetical protein